MSTEEFLLLPFQEVSGVFCEKWAPFCAVPHSNVLCIDGGGGFTAITEIAQNVLIFINSNPGIMLDGYYFFKEKHGECVVSPVGTRL